ncbi:hypothetical protein GCM10007276_31650 [Agaricicola taiwanensis]|uniref:SPW repeat-containing integral membrane domain-containing protein n=1 Tax=Agaricicola taiwanensis TaxID=591372 RepID=A0A8J2YM99_9RHOB|nr:SPW repeat protein [Agaricicola taiwanensis]GGE52317.1 hypothetical protein GCM10007276_31650 [Agaricicola taiwanensis]
MRVLPTYVHGVVDYLVGMVLIALPHLLGFADGTAAQYVPQTLGVAAVVYSLGTRYELGLIGILSMPFHLLLDGLSGLLLLASPWLFGFADRIVWPHVVFGAFEILASLVTKTVPFGRSPDLRR